MLKFILFQWNQRMHKNKFGKTIPRKYEDYLLTF